MCGNDNTIGKTLYIIGNGFDLAHGIRSSYADFKEWCNQRKIACQIDYLLSLNGDWSNIEEALGSYHEDDIYRKIDPYEGVYKNENPFEVVAKIDDSVKFLFKDTIKFLKPAFSDWVKNIDIKSCYKKEKYPLSPDSFYLTFNYTETLEEKYKIPSNQICHIHGCRLENDDEFVFGHNNKRDVFVRDEEMKFDWEVDAKKAIIELMNRFEKSYNQCCCTLKDFITGKHIENIVVYGHSLGKVDWPYFERIIEITGDKVQWEVDCYNDSDRKSMQVFRSQFRLSNIKEK